MKACWHCNRKPRGKYRLAVVYVDGIPRFVHKSCVGLVLRDYGKRASVTLRASREEEG